MPRRKVSRRQFLTRAASAGGGAVAALAGAGLAGYEWPRPSAAAMPNKSGPGSSGSTLAPAATDKPTVPAGGLSFVSRPDLHPPPFSITELSASSPMSMDPNQLVFVSPKPYIGTGPGQAGLMIFGASKKLVWFLPLDGDTDEPYNLQVQTYKGEPVLTWFQGRSTNGHGEGTAFIADASYRTIAAIKAGNGLETDLHECTLTPEGTALITAYRTATTDLSALGGSTSGQVYACQVQEIDIATGKLLFYWDSLEHIPVTDTVYPFSELETIPFDYFHLNSIALTSDGNLLLSARCTSAIYKVARDTGDVLWTLGGKESDFTLGPGAEFHWQHDVRPRSDDLISVFDDGASPSATPWARGIVLSIDETTHQASLVKQFVHPARILAGNQGSMQLLEGGQAFVGWGNQPYCTAFDADGTVAVDVRFAANTASYRSLLSHWVGRPTDQPVVKVTGSTTGGVNVYVSWNGATEVYTWEVLAGSTASDVSPVAVAYRGQFETAITVNSVGPYFVVVAKDISGNELGRSEPVKRA